MVAQQLLDNQKINNTFFYLFERWQDEHDYEDFNYYVKEMKSSVENAIGEVTLLKGMKRPFGIQFIKGNNKYKLFIKNKGKYKYCLACATNKLF